MRIGEEMEEKGLVRTTSGGPILYTVGHSTRSLEDLVALLLSVGVSSLVDVRTVPRSRRTPQFNKTKLEIEIPERGLDYIHFPDLGGFRRPRPDSPNTGWRNESFRGFADYMLGDEFREGLERLLAIASERKTAIMCAESVPWRCHRSLIADAAVVRGFRVWHLLATGRGQEHHLTRFAHVRDGQVTYPGPGEHEER